MVLDCYRPKLTPSRLPYLRVIVFFLSVEEQPFVRDDQGARVNHREALLASLFSMLEPQTRVAEMGMLPIG